MVLAMDLGTWVPSVLLLWHPTGFNLTYLIQAVKPVPQREQHRNMYTIKGETDHRPRLDAWDTRSDLVLWEDLEGAGGEGGGRGDRDGEDMWTQGLFISMYDKIHYK